MKLELILGKYFADGTEITLEQYKKYSQGLNGKNFQIKTIKDEEDKSEIDLIKKQIDNLSNQIKDLSLKLNQLEDE